MIKTEYEYQGEGESPRKALQQITSQFNFEELTDRINGRKFYRFDAKGHIDWEKERDINLNKAIRGKIYMTSTFRDKDSRKFFDMEAELWALKPPKGKATTYRCVATFEEVSEAEVYGVIKQ